MKAADVQAAEASVAEARAMLARYQAQVDRWATEFDRLKASKPATPVAEDGNTNRPRRPSRRGWHSDIK